MTDVPEDTLQYWHDRQESYTEKILTTERRMWRAWHNFKKWKTMIRRLGQKRQGREHPDTLRQFSAKDSTEQFLMDLVSVQIKELFLKLKVF